MLKLFGLNVRDLYYRSMTYLLYTRSMPVNSFSSNFSRSNGKAAPICHTGKNDYTSGKVRKQDKVIKTISLGL